MAPASIYATLDYGDSLGLATGTVDLGDGTLLSRQPRFKRHLCLTAGTYIATFTVLYVNGVSTSVSDAVIITVSPNVTPEQPPLITASSASGTAPLVVTLTSSATMDPNGPLIALTSWTMATTAPSANLY